MLDLSQANGLSQNARSFVLLRESRKEWENLGSGSRVYWCNVEMGKYWDRLSQHEKDILSR